MMAVMNGRTTTAAGVFAGALFAFAVGPPAAGQAWHQRLTAYPTKFYTIYTDLPVETAREAAARMTAMAREYQRRTENFPRKVHGAMRFYLFSRAEDYRAAGGTPGSAGMYNGERLMALADPRRGEAVWRIVQHEGFHQYMHKVVTRRLLPWVDEGLAEYFGEAVWTGDAFVVGGIPRRRLEQVRQLIKSRGLLPFERMLGMTLTQWNADLSGRNYAQAWAMVHFLIHADDGRYRKAFDLYIDDIALRNMPWKKAFVLRFGRDLAGFERRFADWWASLPDDPTAGLETLGAVQTLTSFLGRAVAQGQRFASTAEFFRAAREGRLKQHASQWLPPSLLGKALKGAEKRGMWSLDASGRWPRLVLETRHKRYTGTFAVRGAAAGAFDIVEEDLQPTTRAE